MPALRIADFDTWRPGYGSNSVLVLKAGTEEPCPIFFDEGLTNPAPNPQNLLEKSEGGISYGKFVAPLYVGQAFFLRINSIDQTGVDRPTLTRLLGEDASGALVKVEGGARSAALASILGRITDVRDFGEFLPTGQTGASASTNTTSINAAIGAAAAAGGGVVDIPGGNFQVLSFAIPAGVVVRGRDRDGTTLQSTLAGRILTIAGNSAGFSQMTLDGVSQVGGSVGVYSVGITEPILDDVRVKRFEAGGIFKGGTALDFSAAIFSDCVRGCDVRGDTDAAGGGKGGPIRGAFFAGGRIELCSEYGLNLEFENAAVNLIRFENTIFDTNTGVALRMRGARFVQGENIQFIGNTKNLDIADDEPANPASTIGSARFENTLFQRGEILLKGELEDVVFERCQFIGNRIELTTPRNTVLALDCREDFEVVLAGITTAWQRRFSTESGSTTGLTTGDAPTRTWSVTLQPGQRVFLVAKVIARGRNNNSTGFYYIATSAERPPATLLYDTQTQNFTVGQMLRGVTSGATGRIVTDTDAGATGTLLLTDISGIFLDDEIIRDEGTGSATANGTQTMGAAALVGAVTALRAAVETVAAWDATFAANGPQIELRVTGAAGSSIEWTSNVEVVST